MVKNYYYARRAQSNSQPDSIYQRNRQHFQIYLCTRYHDVLEQSLQRAALITLGLHMRSEAITFPPPLTFRHLDQTEQVLPAGTSLLQVYNQTSGELLVLGELGAGKSTLLVHFAQELLKNAQDDSQQPLPVIFNLSSWAHKQMSLEDWLVEELLVSYQVPHKVGKQWIQNGDILPLFDGLDEIPPLALDLCIDAINSYRSNHLTPFVICSRTTEYLSQCTRLELQDVVVVHPLTNEQLEAYVEAAGPPLAAVQTILQENQVLQKLATSPLILNLLILTYRDASPYALPTSGSIEEQECQIFADYIDRMLTTNGAAHSTRSHKILPRLSWLARQMQKRGQTIFYLEQLQPGWLSHNRLMRVYERFAVRLPGILMGMLLNLAIYKLFLENNLRYLILCLFLGGLLGGILSRGSISLQTTGEKSKKNIFFWKSHFPHLGMKSLITACIALIIGLTFGLYFGLYFGLFTFLFFLFLRTSSSARGSPQRPSVKRVAGYNGLLAVLLVGLSLGLSFGLNTGLSYGLTFGLSYGLASGLLSMLLIGSSPEVRPVDRFVWSWHNLKKCLLAERHVDICFLGFLLIVLGVGLSYGLNYGLAYGFIAGLSYWLLVGLFQGASSETVEHRLRVAPNQRIRHSLRKGLILGVVSSIIVGLIAFLSIGLLIELSYGLKYGLLYELKYGLSNWLSIGLMMGLSIGLLAVLLNGGLAYLRHYTLRFLLWREGSIPCRFPRFLDKAASHLLLRKIGGGYIFIHRRFLDYIASLDLPSPSSPNDIISPDMDDSAGNVV